VTAVKVELLCLVYTLLYEEVNRHPRRACAHFHILGNTWISARVKTKVMTSAIVSTRYVTWLKMAEFSSTPFQCTGIYHLGCS
jgi:hypothetical protein